MKDGVSEWAVLAEEAEKAKDWKLATDCWANAAVDAMGEDIRDEYIAKRNEADRKAVKAEAQEWKPTADQSWLGVKTED